MMQSMIRAIYPPQCVVCGALTLEEFALCGACWSECSFISDLVCEACGLPLPGQGRGGAEYCDECRVTPRPWERGRAVMLYDGKGRDLVLGLKHNDRTDLARPLGTWMARILPELAEGLSDPLLVPVPLHPLRLWARRYNQAALLARRIGKVAGVEVIPDALRRRRRTAKLKTAGVEERFAALAGAFTLHPRHAEQIRGRDLVVVDDVMTSGATLSVAAETLLDGGAASVRVLFLARTAKAP